MLCGYPYLKSEIMKECGDASDSAEEKADVTTWRGRLKKQQDKLGVLQREYKLFLDHDVADPARVAILMLMA